MNFATQQVAEFSTGLILLLSAVLAVFLTKNYLQRPRSSYLFWSIGLWLFAISVSEEVLFSVGYYNQLLARSYLGIVAILVEFLALGSIQLIKSNKIRTTYYAYSIALSLALVYFLITEPVGNIIDNYVVFGSIPLGIITTSALITFPAAVALIVVATLSYKRTRNSKMLSIIAGVIVVSIAGTLYIVQFPALLYYSEFIGILLLWLGFFDSGKKQDQVPVKAIGDETNSNLKHR